MYGCFCAKYWELCTKICHGIEEWVPNFVCTKFRPKHRTVGVGLWFRFRLGLGLGLGLCLSWWLRLWLRLRLWLWLWLWL